MQRDYCARRCHTQATGKLLRPGMPLDAASHLQICHSFTPDSSNGAGSCAAKSHRQNFCASPRRNSSDFINMYRRTPRLAKSAYYWGLELGLRIGEICGLQWGDFDLKLGTLKINRTVCRISCGNGHTKVVIQTPKTRTSRREIPIPKQLSLMLKKLRGKPAMPHGSCPAASPSPPNPAATGKSIKAYLKQATVRQVRPHAPRHICYHLFAGGVRCKDS